MGIGTSIFLIAVGAILAWAVNISDTGGFDINTIGVILMVVGLIGLLASFLFWNSFGGFGTGRSRMVRDEYVDDVPRRRVRRVVEDDIV